MFLERTFRILGVLLIMTGIVACRDAGAPNTTSQNTGSTSSVQTSATSQTERLEWRRQFDVGLEELFSSHVAPDGRSEGAFLTDEPCPLVEVGSLDDIVDAGESTDREVSMLETSGIIVRCRVDGDDKGVALEAHQVRARNATEFLEYQQRVAQVNAGTEESDPTYEIIPDVAGLSEGSVVSSGNVGLAWVGDGVVIVFSVKDGGEVDLDRTLEDLAELVPMVLTTLGPNDDVPSPVGASEDRTEFDTGLTAMIDGLVGPSFLSEVVDDVCPLMDRKALQEFMPDGLDDDELQLRTAISGLPSEAVVACRLNHADTSVVASVGQTRALNLDEFERTSAVQFPDYTIESVDLTDLDPDATGIVREGQDPIRAMWVNDGRVISVAKTIEGEPSPAEDLTDILAAVVPTLLDRLMNPPDAG